VLLQGRLQGSLKKRRLKIPSEMRVHPGVGQDVDVLQTLSTHKDEEEFNQISLLSVGSWRV